MIVCWTLADITETKFTGRPKNQHELRLRNQQRNLETFLQLIGMRNQPTLMLPPTQLKEQDISPYNFGEHYLQSVGFRYNVWMFAVDVEQPSAFDNQNGRLQALMEDFDGVPIITGLEETARIGNTINTLGARRNTFFMHDLNN
ncbi:MAG: hypothetical protein EB168_04170 [Euryarchaeota archaeon]|nr:hypothetical protein [Euryarchaeota archaeon]